MKINPISVAVSKMNNSQVAKSNYMTSHLNYDIKDTVSFQATNRKPVAQSQKEALQVMANLNKKPYLSDDQKIDLAKAMTIYAVTTNKPQKNKQYMNALKNHVDISIVPHHKVSLIDGEMIKWGDNTIKGPDAKAKYIKNIENKFEDYRDKKSEEAASNAEEIASVKYSGSIPAKRSHSRIGTLGKAAVIGGMIALSSPACTSDKDCNPVATEVVGETGEVIPPEITPDRPLTQDKLMAIAENLGIAPWTNSVKKINGDPVVINYMDKIEYYDNLNDEAHSMKYNANLSDANVSVYDDSASTSSDNYYLRHFITADENGYDLKDEEYYSRFELDPNDATGQRGNEDNSILYYKNLPGENKVQTFNEAGNEGWCYGKGTTTTLKMYYKYGGPLQSLGVKDIWLTPNSGD